MPRAAMRTIVVAHARPFVGPATLAAGASVVIAEPGHRYFQLCMGRLGSKLGVAERRSSWMTINLVGGPTAIMLQSLKKGSSTDVPLLTPLLEGADQLRTAYRRRRDEHDYQKIIRQTKQDTTISDGRHIRDFNHLFGSRNVNRPIGTSMTYSMLSPP